MLILIKNESYLECWSTNGATRSSLMKKIESKNTMWEDYEDAYNKYI